MTILSITIESCGVINNFVNDAIHIRELHKCRVNFKFNGVEVTLGGLEREMEEVYTHIRNIEGQKEFAMAVKDFPYSSVMFTARKTGSCPTHCFHGARQEWKVNMLCQIVGDKE